MSQRDLPASHRWRGTKNTEDSNLSEMLTKSLWKQVFSYPGEGRYTLSCQCCHRVCFFISFRFCPTWESADEKRNKRMTWRVPEAGWMLPEGWADMSCRFISVAIHSYSVRRNVWIKIYYNKTNRKTSTYSPTYILQNQPISLCTLKEGEWHKKNPV